MLCCAFKGWKAINNANSMIALYAGILFNGFCFECLS